MWTWMNVWIKLHARIQVCMILKGPNWCVRWNTRYFWLSIKNDEHFYKIASHSCECEYYEQINMWIVQHVSVVNQMIASTQEGNQHQGSRET